MSFCIVVLMKVLLHLILCNNSFELLENIMLLENIKAQVKAVHFAK